MSCPRIILTWHWEPDGIHPAYILTAIGIGAEGYARRDSDGQAEGEVRIHYGATVSRFATSHLGPVIGAVRHLNGAMLYRPVRVFGTSNVEIVEKHT